jgi:hypothetical protein
VFIVIGGPTCDRYLSNISPLGSLGWPNNTCIGSLGVVYDQELDVQVQEALAVTGRIRKIPKNTIEVVECTETGHPVIL